MPWQTSSRIGEKKKGKRIALRSWNTRTSSPYEKILEQISASGFAFFFFNVTLSSACVYVALRVQDPQPEQNARAEVLLREKPPADRRPDLEQAVGRLRRRGWDVIRPMSQKNHHRTIVFKRFNCRTRTLSLLPRCNLNVIREVLGFSK